MAGNLTAPEERPIRRLMNDLDQHGRPIADVWVKGKSVDQELLDEGLAIAVRD